MKIRNLLAALTLTVGITMAALPMTSYSQTQDNVVSAKVEQNNNQSGDKAVMNVSFQGNASVSIPLALSNINTSNLEFNIQKYLLMSFIATLMALAIYLFL